MKVNCDCRSELEDKLLARFKEQQPDASSHSAELQGYCLAIVGNTAVSIPAMEVKMSADYPLKKGGTKRKTKTGNMMFSYCPFCGEKIEKDAS